MDIVRREELAVQKEAPSLSLTWLQLVSSSTARQCVQKEVLNQVTLRISRSATKSEVWPLDKLYRYSGKAQVVRQFHSLVETNLTKCLGNLAIRRMTMQRVGAIHIIYLQEKISRPLQKPL